MRTRLPILLLAVVAFFQASALSAQTTPRTYVFGSSCGGAPAGTALISIDPTTVADLGDTLRVRLTGAPPNISVALNLDTKLKASNSTPTQLKRFKLASPSCIAQVSPYTTNQGISHWTTTNANGEAYIDLRIPDHSSYDGVRFNMQWMMSSAVGGTQAMTVSDAISTVIRQEIVLRDVGVTLASTNGRTRIAMTNTVPGGFTYITVPVPVQSTESVQLKSMRIVGGYGATGQPASGSADFSVWSSAAAIPGNYMTGNVYNGWVSPPISATPFGASSLGLTNYDYRYNLLHDLAGLTLNGGTQYFLGFSIETAGYSTFGVSDLLSTTCQPNTLYSNGWPNGLLIQGGGISSGCIALEIRASVR